MRSQPFQAKPPPDIHPNEVFLAGITVGSSFHAQECLYVRREEEEEEERGVLPRLLDWLILIQFDTEDRGSTFLQKFGIHLYHCMASLYRKQQLKIQRYG